MVICLAELMLASRTERTLVEAAEVPWSPGFFSTDYLVLETSLDSLVLVTLVLVAVEQTLLVLGHNLQSQHASPHVQ